MRFAASYDSATKVTSVIVFVVLAVVALVVHQLPIMGLCALIVLVSYGYSPQGYVVADGEIVVRRLFGGAHIRLETLREVRATTPDDVLGCIRLLGNGGFFGYYGLFQTSRFGRCTWYVTNRAQSVVVVTSNKTALFSPDDVGGFIATVQSTGQAQPMHLDFHGD